MTETPRDLKDKVRPSVRLSSIALAKMHMLTHHANNRFTDNKRVISRRSAGAFTRNYADLRADSRLLTALANKHPHVIYGTHSHAADEIRKWYRENVAILVMWTGYFQHRRSQSEASGILERKRGEGLVSWEGIFARHISREENEEILPLGRRFSWARFERERLD